MREINPSHDRDVTGMGIARLSRAWRIGWTVLTICVVQSFVCAAALVPVLWTWLRILDATESAGARTVVFAIIALPSYAIFALLLMMASAVTARALGWRTPANLEMHISLLEWPLLQWVRSMVATHIVRLCAGTLYRGSPVWTAYLRLSGARIGRRVYINSLAVSDYNLLEFGDDVVIGQDVHLSGHTVEHSVVKTASVRLGRSVTIGLGSVVDIGVEVGEGAQIGALSFVPKHTRLAPYGIYAGIPVHRIGPRTETYNPAQSSSDIA